MDNIENDFTPLDSYAADLAKLRVAAATPSSTFEDDWRASRLRELAAEDAEVAQLRTAHEARLTAPSPQSRLTAAALAEIEQYAPPDPYAAGIRKLQEEMKR